jgi:transketolase
MDAAKIQEAAKKMRRKILDISFSCEKSVHMGGALSMVDILATLYGEVLEYDVRNPFYEDRDRFILSKGHGALGLYSALLVSGFLTEEEFATFQTNESDLTTHPVMNISMGIESSNGSLGQGLSMAVGLAIAAKRKSRGHRIFVMLGDGECNEGAVWEAAMSAPNFKLDNLYAIVDNNGLQNDGSAESVMDCGDLVEKWRSFGWNVRTVDGHDVLALKATFAQPSHLGKPTAVVAKTIKGKGVSFMENNNEWHHNRLTKTHYENAMKEFAGSL